MLIAVVLCCTATKVIPAQTTDARQPLVIGGTEGIDGTNCETTKSDFDSIASATRSGLIIIIARRGRGERSSTIVARRLQNIRGYLMATRGVQEHDIVTAQGEPTNGLGQVEVYISGNLFVKFLMKTNRDFFKNCAA
ncbi:MAG TPA: hypothetical protein VF297_08730 [Pyrinomonadaceae bacterium]